MTQETTLPLIQSSQLMEVLNVPNGAEQWKSMGTEYTHSIYAIKELIENSLSASGSDSTDIIIKIVSVDTENVMFSIEDKSGGVDDINLLLTISSDSKKKLGKYSVYGHGLKHAIAYFQEKFQDTNWIIQSRTPKLLQESKMIEIKAPYLYPHEYNIEFNHKGIHATTESDEFYKGEFKDSGTYIEFVTEKDKLNKLNPFGEKGRGASVLQSIAQKLSDMISLFYMPLLRDNKLNVKIKYGDNIDDLTTINVKSLTFPYLSIIGKNYKNKIHKLKNGGEQKVSIQYLELDRTIKHPFIFAQGHGLVSYINGILVEGFSWDYDIFGGVVDHPSLNSLLCLLEVESDKENAPELSVSKTKFRTSGKNYLALRNFVSELCPKQQIQDFRISNNTTNETAMRDRRFDLLKDTKDNLIFIYKEQQCGFDGNMLGSRMRYDIRYMVDTNGGHKLHIEEFKKEQVRPQDVAQIIQYGAISQNEFSDANIQLTLSSLEITPDAKLLLDMYVSMGYNIEFKTFAQLHCRVG
jgi:hypothetical protein